MRNEMTPLPILLAANFRTGKSSSKIFSATTFRDLQLQTCFVLFFFFSYSPSRFDSWVVKSANRSTTI